jgi:hypothetical protein
VIQRFVLLRDEEGIIVDLYSFRQKERPAVIEGESLKVTDPQFPVAFCRGFGLIKGNNQNSKGFKGGDVNGELKRRHS